jgi:lysophospholipase L1-like esterase
MSRQPLPEQQLRLLHLGDSYTCAEGIDPEGGWPFQVRRLLEGRGVRVAETRQIAKTGWTCAELLAGMRSADLKPDWDRITICIGVNNQYRGLDPASFRLELEQLVQEARLLLRKPPDGLLLLSIPDWGVSPFARDRDREAVAGEIDAFNAVVRTIALKTRVPFLDWTPLTRTFADQPSAFAPDDLHPSASQYAAWAKFIAELQLGY